MVCKRCGVDKPITEFYADKTVKSGVMGKCKECVKKSVQDRYAQKKDEILKYHRKHYLTYKDKQRQSDAEYHERVENLKTPCVKCGESRSYIIDFHHIDPSQKAFNIHRRTCKTNFSIIEEEVSKCVCMCRNCHAEFHYLYGVIPKNPVEDLNEYLRRG